MGQFGVVLEVAAIYNDQRAGGSVGERCQRCSRLWCSHRNLNLLPSTTTTTSDDNGHPPSSITATTTSDDNNNNNDNSHTVNATEQIVEPSQETMVHTCYARRQSPSEQQDTMRQIQLRKGTTTTTTSSSFESSTTTRCSQEEDYIHDLRNYMSLHYLRKSDGVPRYAVKQIRKDLYPKKKVEAAVELAREAKLLKHLNHPHIIQLKATVSTPGHVDFMMVLERLSNGTLHDKLMVPWKAAQSQISSSSKGGRFLANLWLPHKNKNNNNNNSNSNIDNVAHTLLMDRLLALYDIAQAMAYLHSKM